jgi:hypothetical protein
MALGVTGMHYVGMAALGVQLHEDAGHVATGQTPTSLAFPMLIAPSSSCLSPRSTSCSARCCSSATTRRPRRARNPGNGPRPAADRPTARS